MQRLELPNTLVFREIVRRFVERKYDMNIEQLYKDLVALCETNEAFFFKDFTYEGYTHRIFNYRLATYSDFMLPGAIEARGIMFVLGPDMEMIRCVCRPMEKFFNAGENPSTMNLDYSYTKKIMFKEDGSLISTYLDISSGDLMLKTKGSLNSEQCIDAMKFMRNNLAMSDSQFVTDLYWTTVHGWTVNMEWVAPWNRIVLHYAKPALVILNVRNNDTGEYMDESDYPESFKTYVVANYEPWEDTDHMPAPDQLVEFIHSRENFEGVVVQLNSGQHVKIKTNWYTVLHRAKDSVDNPKSLIEAVLAENTDDLRQLFSDMPEILDRIGRYEEHVSHKFNHIVAALNGFKEYMDSTGDYTRKDYAIAAKDQWSFFPEFFGVQMNMLVRPEKSVDDQVKEVMMKNYRDYVLPEDVKEESEE